ncbi:MAG TPA: phosphoribosylamine--glycine ligase [Flammeovirgaceae bacterium]|nr:phosphoribosylamine--glycine ligase [Flammeovirgaceae bacterium]
MNILVLGSGGREHALAWKIAQSPQCDKLFIAPGNAGTAQTGTNLALAVNDFAAIAEAINTHQIDLLVVGPEDPLVNGIYDYLRQEAGLHELLIIGPDAAGAQLEGSKDFAKRFMQQNGIPTAAARTFVSGQEEEAYRYIDTQSPPIVVKADGLAAGKGVIIAQSQEEAKEAVHSMLVNEKFAAAGKKLLIEQFLEGIELSVFVLTDGRDYKILPEAKDYKRIGEQDTGPNTGGMGAVSPVPFATAEFMQKVESRIVQPTLAGLRQAGSHYAGFIFIGLMNVQGDPYVIEYNVRMGDPETQVVMPRLQTDLLALLTATASGKLKDIDLQIAPQTATTVVAVAGGYPGQYEKGHEIQGLEQTGEALVFHAGTKADGDRILTNGGRVLAATGLGADMEAALAQSYGTLAQISWPGMYYRQDIGRDLLRWQQQ